VELNKRYGCTLQMGGSDQWGNILQGVELGRRVREKELFGLTSPLITSSSGAKMGKTASGAVWLSGKRLSAYDYWQYWRNTEDADVGRFLRMFTDLPLAQIVRLERLQGAEINEAKKILATETTRLCHGDAAARTAAETAAKTFSGAVRGAATDSENISSDPGVLPIVTLDGDAPMLVIDVVVKLGMASSKSDARRLIEQGGVKLNDQPVQAVTATVSGADLDERGNARLAVGKKRHGLIKRE
jgi:tyrosyl-tRNA synthetase